MADNPRPNLINNMATLANDGYNKIKERPLPNLPQLQLPEGTAHLMGQVAAGAGRGVADRTSKLGDFVGEHVGGGIDKALEGPNDFLRGVTGRPSLTQQKELDIGQAGKDLDAEAAATAARGQPAPAQPPANNIDALAANPKTANPGGTQLGAPQGPQVQGQQVQAQPMARPGSTISDAMHHEFLNQGAQNTMRPMVQQPQSLQQRMDASQQVDPFEGINPHYMEMMRNSSSATGSILALAMGMAHKHGEYNRQKEELKEDRAQSNDDRNFNQKDDAQHQHMGLSLQQNDGHDRANDIHQQTADQNGAYQQGTLGVHGDANLVNAYKAQTGAQAAQDRLGLDQGKANQHNLEYGAEQAGYQGAKDEFAAKQKGAEYYSGIQGNARSMQAGTGNPGVNGYTGPQLNRGFQAQDAAARGDSNSMLFGDKTHAYGSMVMPRAYSEEGIYLGDTGQSRGSNGFEYDEQDSDADNDSPTGVALAAQNYSRR